MLNKTFLLLLSLFLLVAAAPVTAAAQEATKGDGWKFGVELYGWAASVGGKSASGGDIDVDFDDLLSDLEMAFMGGFAARKGKWSLLADVMYLNLEDDEDVAPGVKTSVEVKGWVVTPLIGYNFLETEKISLHGVAGARYLWLKAYLDLSGYPAVSDKGHVWDAVVGVRGQVTLTKKWYLPFYGDVGTGDSDLTWQVLAGIGYKFKWFDVVAAYRYLDWDFDDNAAIDDLNFSGPIVGIKFVF